VKYPELTTNGCALTPKTNDLRKSISVKIGNTNRVYVNHWKWLCGLPQTTRVPPGTFDREVSCATRPPRNNLLKFPCSGQVAATRDLLHKRAGTGLTRGLTKTSSR
jgi:hypothetical protein